MRAAFSLLILLTLGLRKLTKKRTSPTSDCKKPTHKLSYSLLRHATYNFSAHLLLGQGGSGSVYRGTIKLNSIANNLPFHVAIKLMDSGSLQGEREFQNELSFSSKIDSQYIVSVIGFSSNPRKHRMLLVYELMENGSLQDCLFHKKSEELKNWDNRFLIALNIAKGLEYLHHYCDPPIIHGDIKPSNILLDGSFNAKIADFGLARLKLGKNELGNEIEDNGSVLKEIESEIIASSSPEEIMGVELSPEAETTPAVSPTTVAAMTSPCTPEGNLDTVSIDSGGKGAKSKAKKGRMKDYVMEWIKNEITERPKSELVRSPSRTEEIVELEKEKQFDWWASLEHNKNSTVKRRPAREWWKEEYCEELEKKNKKKHKHLRGSLSNDPFMPRDEQLYTDRKKRRRNGSRGSIDWWLDGFRGVTPKSGGTSSTPSMRGTVCYVAPEYGAGVDVSEKCDVYSFGVSLLVLIAGRRPLQITGSPMSEFQRDNLLSWARHLACTGKLLDLVDRNIRSLNKEKVELCITVALLCLQRSPVRRPSMKEVVGILSGDLETPRLPVEFARSSPSRYPFKSRKKFH